jgi:two-component system cell cycle response regulator
MSREFTNLQFNRRRVLVFEEDPAIVQDLLVSMRWEGFEVQTVSNELDALKIVNTWIPHLIIFDWKNPNIKGEFFLKKVRERVPHIACIVVSDDSSNDAVISALDSGADDYIVKPFVPLVLMARIRSQMRIRELNDQLVFANEKLRELVDIDDLTGLYNMRSLYQKLDFEMDRGRRYKREVCVVMMDMDYFKSVNDGHDHLFGSYVLSEVGKIIRANTRNTDISARYGGDEFLMVLTETNYHGSIYFCEKLRDTISNCIFKNEEDVIKLTASLGFAITVPNGDVTSRELVRRADRALYEAKRSGRNQVRYYLSEQESGLQPNMSPTKKKAAG